MTGQTVDEILELAIQIEEKAASLYSILEKRFDHVVDMPEFWHELSLDELEHAKILLSIYKSISEENLKTAAQVRICESMNANLILMNDTLKAPINTLDDAFELAYSLEFSEINAVFKFLSTKFITEKFRVELITSQIDDHQKKMMDFDKKFGDKNWRRQFKILPE